MGIGILIWELKNKLMEIVKAFKHEETGRIFPTEQSYNKFVETYNERLSKKKERDSLVSDFQKNLHFPRKNSKSLSELLFRLRDLMNLYNPKKVKNIRFNGTLIANGASSFKPISESPKNMFYIEGKMEIEYTDGHKSDSSANLKVLVPKEVSKIEGDYWPIPGVNLGYINKVVIYMSDIPGMEENVKEYLEKRNELKTEMKKFKDDEKSYLSKKNQDVDNSKSVREIKSIIEDLEMQALKISTSISIQKKVLLTHRTEMIKEYEIMHPFNHERINEIQNEIDKNDKAMGVALQN